MEFIITRKKKGADGMFSTMTSVDGSFSCVTLEHAYEDGKGGFEPKIPPGTYQCQRGMHQLLHMDEPIETFELFGVEGHDRLLFHVGNYDHDSHGCILLGRAIVNDMITDSRATFQKFMELQEGVDEFPVLIQDAL